MQKTPGTAKGASASAARWPQYRKFSHQLSARALGTRLLVSCAVVAVFIAAWQTPQTQQPTGVQPVHHVRLQRVEIVGKREPAGEPTDSVALSTRRVAPQLPGFSAPAVGTN